MYCSFLCIYFRIKSFRISILPSLFPSIISIHPIAFMQLLYYYFPYFKIALFTYFCIIHLFIHEAFFHTCI